MTGRANRENGPARVGIAVEIVADPIDAANIVRCLRAGFEAAAAMFDLVPNIDTEAGAAERQRNTATSHNVGAGQALTVEAETRAAFEMIRAGRAIRAAAADPGLADLGSWAEVATAAAVEIVGIRVDAAHLAADDAGALPAGSGVAESRATFEVIDACGLGEEAIVTRGTDANVKIEGGVWRA